MNRLTDSDKQFGPVTYGKTGGWKPLAVELRSGGEDNEGANLTLYLAGYVLRLVLPRWVLRPYKEKHIAEYWSAATIERLGRDWYWNIDERAIGFLYHEGHITFKFGRQTGDSSTDRSCSYFLPWTQWRFIQIAYYDLDGGRFFQGPDYDLDIKDACTSRSFSFTDFDGEQLTAKTIIEEREWRLGTGRFTWLSWFKEPKVIRSLDIRFSGEVGRKKDSWKGGTIEHGIDMLPGETHQDAFVRYCNAHELIFHEEILG